MVAFTYMYMIALSNVPFNVFGDQDAGALQIHVQSPYDRHVMAKHSEVYPAAEELEAVQTIISDVECALKNVSDQMDTPNDDKEKTKMGR